MGRSWKLGTALGIGIYVHWTFLLLVGYVLYHYWGIGGWELALYGLQFLLAVIGCVILHELGHALMARRFGIGTRSITIYIIGGVARLERMSERPWEEICIALAGPAVNVVIAIGLTLALMLSAQPAGFTPAFFNGNILFDVLAANVMLVIFNLLPAFPMDGGRVLRALLVIPYGRLRGTEIAANVGACFSVLFAVLGLKYGFSLVLIGMFAFLAGQQELAAVRYQEWRRRAAPLDVMPADAELLDVIPVPLDESVSVRDNQAGAWVIYRNGRPVRP